VTIFSTQYHQKRGGFSPEAKSPTSSKDMKAFVIKNGKDYMPAHKYLTDAEVRAVVNYITSFSKGAD